MLLYSTTSADWGLIAEPGGSPHQFPFAILVCKVSQMAVTHPIKTPSPDSRGTKHLADRTHSSLPLKSDSIPHVIAEIEGGLPFSSLDSFQRFTGLSIETIASLIRVPLRTLSRRRAAGRLKPEESERLLRISRIVDQAIALFEGDRDAAMQWLATPQPGLNAQKPLEFARTEIGAREVEDLIGRLEHGVFS